MKRITEVCLYKNCAKNSIEYFALNKNICTITFLI